MFHVPGVIDGTQVGDLGRTDRRLKKVLTGCSSP